ncbi:MAG: DEAD/DEAH box helicase [Cyanobacteria bacterium]|nr:DEAD/DEAH box helicase [Cyanobacteriota bacterium]
MKQLAPIEAWFERQGWRPMPFQRQCWKAYLQGRSGLIQVPTGAGKTYAAVMGPIAAMLAEQAQLAKTPEAVGPQVLAPKKRGPKAQSHPGGTPLGLRLLVLTPLRALSRDLQLAIEAPISAMGWPLRVGLRNGDTSSSVRTRQLRQPPEILITTPESLCLLLANPAAPVLFAGLEAVVLDEWHELMGSKRGSQCELALSWLRRQCPSLRTWAISATIGNLEEAAQAAIGVSRWQDGHWLPAAAATIITAHIQRRTTIRSLLPESIDGFPWAGHLGLRMHEELVAQLRPEVSTLLFTNTRNQAERWHQCLRYACPEMEDSLALHHSAIDRSRREAIEAAVKAGEIRWVVCTSSLDLGVDFQPVESVVQIGSAKNLARLLQRAGRSAHKPGGTSQVLFMPTHALELLEVSAIRRGLAAGLVEHRPAPRQPVDVLLQHLVTLACGPGFDPELERESVRSCWSYRQLDQETWQWCLRFLEQGGDCLGAYPRYRKLERQPMAPCPGPEGALATDAHSGERHDHSSDPEGTLCPERRGGFLYRITAPALARLHRLNIGTITADRAVTVRYVRGAVLGHVEEAFISRLHPGDVFFFAGRQLEFVRLREMTAMVKATSRKSSTVPAWAGGQMAISDLLSEHLRREVDRCARALDRGTRATDGDEPAAGLDSPELRALEPLLRRQADLSQLPRHNQLLIEFYRSREGSHLYAYPFEGRFVHEGLGFLWAWRLARHKAGTITVSVNDYGFELLAPRGYPFEALVNEHHEALLDDTELEADLQQAINLSELCRRRFRAIAQVSGLVLNGYPGQARTGSQLQISAALLYDVFLQHEPANRLLAQAHQEVLEEQLERHRLQTALTRLQRSELLLQATARPGPLAFPLLAERLNNRLSNESLLERLARLRAEAERIEQ